MKILATSGGFLPSDIGPFQWRRGPLIEHAVALAGNPERPRFCFLGTATGDNVNYVAGFYNAMSRPGVPAVAPRAVFSMPNTDRRPRGTCSMQDRIMGRRRLGRQPAGTLATAWLATSTA